MVQILENLPASTFPLDLALEIVYSYFMTNNVLRFVRFVQAFISKGCRLVVPFVFQFHSFLIREYKSWNGNVGGKHDPEGLGRERWQTTFNRLQSDFGTYATLRCLRALVMEFNKTFPSGTTVTLTGFKRLMPWF